MSLAASELGITHRPVEVRLAFFQRRGAIGGGHRLLAHAGVIGIFDAHPATLPSEAALNTSCFGSVPMRDSQRTGEA